MTRPIPDHPGGRHGKRRFGYKNAVLHDPAIQRWAEWSVANRKFFDGFRTWLKESSYSDSALGIYGAAVRTAIGYLRKEYWEIDPEIDLARVIAHVESGRLSPASCACYRKGLMKFAEYLRLSLQIPAQPKELHWTEQIGTLPAPLQQDIREFIRFSQRNWKEAVRFERSADALFTISRPLRWMAEGRELTAIQDLTPQLWYAWADKRLSGGISATTINGELSALKHFVYFVQENGRPVCERFLMVERLDQNKLLPKDVPLEQLKKLQKAIQAQIGRRNPGQKRMGRLDLAWFLLMLHSGLRTGEIRNLKLADIEWEAKRVRIEQSKGLKDRLVPLSDVTMQALRAYLEVRGPAGQFPETVFLYRNEPLTKTYCFQRLETYGRRSGGIRVAPHRLRHSCATLLLNSGAPVLAVQTILGHKQVDTTLGYARLYDGTVAADYYSAMNHVERQLALPEDRMATSPGIGQLLALVDALRRDTLSPSQIEITRTLREGLSRMAEKEMATV